MPVPFRLPKFYPILDTAVLNSTGYSLPEVGKVLVNSGIRVLQYRHKGPWTQQHFDEAKELSQSCNHHGILFVLNDRADYSKLLKTALHIGQDDLPPLAARQLIGDEVMGLSTHNREQLSRGNDENVEYLSVGPIFATNSKQQADPAIGLEKLAELRTLTEKPLAAIGGITTETASATIAAGADSLAVISGLYPPGGNLRAFKKQLDVWINLLL